MDIEEVVFKPREVIEACAGTMLFASMEKGLQITYEVDPDVPQQVRGDVTRVRQILNNLLGNAVKFTTSGNISLRLRRATSANGEFLDWMVIDTGMGLTESQQARIFEPFVQADASTSRRFGGTGLGLAICRHLAKLMGGTISLRSELGKGSEFSVRLPLHEVVSATDQVISGSVLADSPLGSSEPLRILVAEDNPSNQRLVALFLQKMGYQPRLVFNGTLAVDAVRDENYDVVLMDLQMPVMDGYDATRMIRETLPAEKQPWIIALTAHAMETERQHCLEVGMNDFLTKPLRRELLEASLLHAAKKRDTRSSG